MVSVGDLFEVIDPINGVQKMFVGSIDYQSMICTLSEFTGMGVPSKYCRIAIADLLADRSAKLISRGYEPKLGMNVRFVADLVVNSKLTLGNQYTITEVHIESPLSWYYVKVLGDNKIDTHRLLWTRFSPIQTTIANDDAVYCGMFDLSDRKTLMEI